MPWYLYLALKQLFPSGKRFPFFTAISILGVALVVPHLAWAGAQQYEELSAAVRSAMTAAATDPAVGEPIWASRRHRIDWLSLVTKFEV